MKTVLCLLALGGVVAQLPPDTPEPPDPTEPSGSKPDSAVSSSGSSGESTGTTTSTTSWNSGPSGTGSYAYAGSGWGNTNWGSVGGSGSGWDWLWDGDAGWGPNSELWHFRPSWNWDSPYPPEGTMYVENWGNPPTREIPARRSFYLGADNGVSLAGATVEGGHADCGWRDWCVHLTFHSSYGVLSDFDAFVLDRYDSADRIYGDGLWNAREDDQGPPRAFAPLVLGGFSPEERAVLGNISSWRVEEMARRFNETRTTTWTLYPDSDEMDVILSFKQLFTLLPGYPNGNVTQSSLNSDIISEWGPADQVLLRVTAKRQGSGATSSMMPRVLNFTGSQLFQVEYFSSLEYPQNDDGNLNASANAMTLDVVFSRRRYGSGLPWNPARPSDACDACNQRVMNHPVVARCLHGNVPERIFQDIYEQSASEQMEWDGGEWNVGDMGAPSNLSYNLNDVVDSCFGLRWLLSGQVNDGSWSSSLGFPDVGDHRSSSGSEFGDAGFRWSGTGSGSGNDGGSRYSSEYRDPVYRYDESGSRWSSWGYRDDGSASKFGNAGSRRSSSGSSGGPNAGDWPSVRDLWVGTRNFAEAAGRMVVLEHEHAFVRVNFTKPSYKFYVWMALAGLGPEGQFKTPVLSSDNTPGEIAELVAQAVPNASEYNLAVDVRMFNNSELIAWVNMLNEWMADYYKSGGSESEASAAWAEYSSSSDSSSFQFPPVGEASETGDHPNAGQQSDSVDGSSPDAGQGSDGSGRWWFGDPYPVPEPQFTVQISLRNVSVIPNILEVVTIGDESMDSAESKVSYDARGSELRFQLSPLNLTKFEYVPPPPYVNLTWSEDTPDYPDLYWNGSSIWNDTDIWSICSECADAYTACDNSVSCSLGVHGFLERGLSQSRFNASEISGDNDNYNRQPWGVDFGPTLRQSASFFTSEGYDTFMDFMVCLHKSACALDLPRQAYNYSKGEYDAVGPTQLEIIPAESVFVVPTNSTGGLENIVMRFQDKESVLEWSSTVEEDYPSSIREFVEKVMSEYSAENKFWTRNPSQNAWAKVDYESEYYRDGKSLGRIFRVTFADNFFNDAEQPRFRPISADTYDELNSSNWKVLVFAYRNPYDEARNVLVPLLRNVTLPLSTSTQSDGPTLVKLDFSSALLSLENDAFQSREGWLAFAHLLHAMSSCGCEVGFGQWNTMKYEPTRVRIESDSVDLSVRLYPNTQLDVWFNGNLFSYSTDGASSPNDAANNFLNWFTTTANSEPFYLVVDHIDTTVDDISQSATITLKLYGVYDVDSESQPLVNPNWIPNFFVKSDDVSAVPPAEVNVTPWKISLQSTDRYPPFDRLLDLLEYGAASDEMPSSYGGSWGSSTNGNWEWSASGSYAAGSFSGDACARCADLRQACFDDMDCQSAISNYLLPTLNSMGSWPTPDGYSSDMSSQVLSNVFGGMQSSESKRKLFALLTCSATKWTSTPSEEGVSCVQLQATTEYPDGNAMLEIIPAFSVFPINKGQGRTIYTSAGNPLYPTNTPLYYSDNGDSTELTDFMENQILGGYDNTGVKVKVSADWNSEMYNVIFDGLTATSTPYVEGETSSSTTQFKFSASTDNMVAMFSPWMQWLDPGLAS
ncbi:hypothetical protein PR002_g10694 [Phytophthora rubi]|uniref:Uncharacterized protein n=1 Tax=Phytophthora rubi TaxID=129364 RepID=A0A6A3MAS8_9STRA|nr:hypothetical protein PR002_g10694 [Phytophthora rubi]